MSQLSLTTKTKLKLLEVENTHLKEKLEDADRRKSELLHTCSKNEAKFKLELETQLARLEQIRAYNSGMIEAQNTEATAVHLKKVAVLKQKIEEREAQVADLKFRLEEISSSNLSEFLKPPTPSRPFYSLYLVCLALAVGLFFLLTSR
mmetsp:Transcript_25696/g.45031  ORF Transcript_25696/g.45031 Transcript_25696/m.45031 type:complete len:148 (+) Transcript_25696:2131-2574(+)